MQQIWIDTNFDSSGRLALEAASKESAFEVVGITDASGDIDHEAIETIASLGYVVPIGTSQEPLLVTKRDPRVTDAVEEEAPGTLLLKSATDVGRMSLVLLSGPVNATEAITAFVEDYETSYDPTQDATEDVAQTVNEEAILEREEISYADIPFGTVYWNLGEVEETAGDHFVTKSTRENAPAWEELLALGVQRLVLDPMVARQLDIPEKLELALREKLKSQGMAPAFDWNSLLTMYMVVAPQAFVFAERGVHLHTHGPEKGWMHFDDGADVLVATSVNAASFAKWVQDRL